MKPIRKQIADIRRRVGDPELGINGVELGLISLPAAGSPEMIGPQVREDRFQPSVQNLQPDR